MVTMIVVRGKLRSFVQAARSSPLKSAINRIHAMRTHLSCNSLPPPKSHYRHNRSSRHLNERAPACFEICEKSTNQQIVGCNDLYTFRNSKKLDSSFNTQTRQVSGVLTDIYTCRGAKNSREKHGGGEKQRMAAGGKSGVEGSALRQDSNKWKMGRLSFPLVKHAARLESRT